MKKLLAFLAIAFVLYCVCTSLYMTYKANKEKESRENG